jgi:predicted ATPase
MFDAVRFLSYKCLADVPTIELGRMTLLLGANASGKSSVLDGLHLLCQLGVPQVDESHANGYRPGAVFSGLHSAERLRTFGRTGPLRIEASAGQGEVTRVALAVAAEPAFGSADVRFTVEVELPGESRRSITVPPNPSGTTAFFHDLETRGFGRAVRLRLDSAKVAGFAPDSKQPRVEHDGAGTAAVIAWLAERRAPELDAIEADLRRVVPRARRLVPERAEPEGRLGRLFKLEMEGGAEVPADLLSEGTLLTIGLLTVLHGSPAPRLVLLDDFDRALHPKAQAQLVACVKDMLVQRTDLQFVCTTHSPYVLDLFEAEDVRVLRADAQGFTRARKLTEHPEWVQWNETLKAGEFWSYVGEDWLDGPADGG